MSDRYEIADFIVDRMTTEMPRIKEQYLDTRGQIGFFYIDDLLPESVALSIYEQFPRPETMKLKRTLREYKYIAAQMNQYNPILEECVYAFQDSRVVDLIKDVVSIDSAYPDTHLYAGGISMMGMGQYLNPHLDNSHDKDRNRWRVLNLLYYVSPDWIEEFGGNLELWPDGPDGIPLTIPCQFNRLAVMATHNRSWHSVNEIKVDAYRCCVSNYYFSDEPLGPEDHFHVTSFRGRPEQKFRNIILRADSFARMAVRRVFANGIAQDDHIYKK